ncbi:Lrp/AsnC family transcriptional regulator [Anaerolineales bacterium HSG25]|nr:Lrp/AsnC family transcriptional regulator [Anaerolineales bacterium HSG25]
MTKSIKLTEADLAIIRILQQDGRRAYADIAAEIGLAPSTVQQRANRLINAGVIKITALVDPMVVGISVMGLLSVKVDSKYLLDAAKAIGEFNEVDYVVICTGSYNLLVEIACQDNDAVLRFISNELAQVEGVRDVETSLYLRIVKDTDQWIGPS